MSRKKSTSVRGCLALPIVLIGGCYLLNLGIEREPQPSHSGSPSDTSSTRSTETTRTETESTTLPYTIVESIEQPPIKCQYKVRVDFVGERLPTEEELVAVSNEIKSRNPRSERTFVLFYLAGEDPHGTPWASAHHTPELAVDIFRTPDSPEVQTQERFGLSMAHRKRFWFERAQIDERLFEVRDAAYSEGKQNDHPIVVAAEKKAKRDNRLLLIRYGISADQAGELIAEGLDNAWPLLDGDSLQQAIDALPEPMREPEYRTWSDASGEHQTEAEFAGYINGTVKLRRKDGRYIELPMEKLSESDQQWIRDRGSR